MTQWVADAPAPEATSVSTRKRDLATIAILALLFYGLNVDFWVYGDSAMYADFSLRREFVEVTLHLGYYWIVILAQNTLGALFHLPIQETMGWVNVTFGVGTLCVSYLLALELLGSRRTTLIAVAILGVSGRMLNNSTSSEIYITQTFFVLLSFWLFTRERIFWAAAAAAMSMLISPLSLFAFLFFPVFDYQRAGRIRWSVLIKLAVLAFLMYLPYLALHWHDLFWGRRGLLNISANTRTDPLTSLRNFPKYQFKQFTLMLFLVIPALLAWKRDRRFVALALAVALPHLIIILKLTGEDNVFILNTDFFFAVLLTLGWSELARRKATAWMGPATFVGHVGLLLASGAIFAFNSHRGYPTEIRDTYVKFVRNQPNVAVVTDWGTAMAFVLYARDSATTRLEREPVYQQIFDIDNEPGPSAPVRRAQTLYVVDRWNPSPLNALLHSKESLEKLALENSLKNVAERRLDLTCTLLSAQVNRLYQCARNAPSTDPSKMTLMPRQ
ncbi:MAG: hypothetical protein ABJB74_12610 [Gemmatimonas sp.]